VSSSRKFWILFFVLTGAWPLALIVYVTRPKPQETSKPTGSDVLERLEQVQ
jgi:hypothetical protein